MFSHIIKKKFAINYSLKTDVGTETEFSDKQDCLKKQQSSGEQNSSRKQVSSKKQNNSKEQDSFGDIIKDVDPNIIFEKLNTSWEKPNRLKIDLMLAKMMSDELLGVKSKTKGE